MPVVTVTLPRDAATPALLACVADGVANALNLRRGDVIAMAVLATPPVGGAEVESDDALWPLISIHGSDRGGEAVARARGAAETAVRHWADREGRKLEGVWSEWVQPQPTPV